MVERLRILRLVRERIALVESVRSLRARILEPSAADAPYHSVADQLARRHRRAHLAAMDLLAQFDGGHPEIAAFFVFGHARSARARTATHCRCSQA